MRSVRNCMITLKSCLFIDGLKIIRLRMREVSTTRMGWEAAKPGAAMAFPGGVILLDEVLYSLFCFMSYILVRI